MDNMPGLFIAFVVAVVTFSATFHQPSDLMFSLIWSAIIFVVVGLGVTGFDPLKKHDKSKHDISGKKLLAIMVSVVVILVVVLAGVSMGA